MIEEKIAVIKNILDNSVRFPLDRFYYVIHGKSEIDVVYGQLIGYKLNIDGTLIALVIRFSINIQGNITFANVFVPSLAVLNI